MEFFFFCSKKKWEQINFPCHLRYNSCFISPSKSLYIKVNVQHKKINHTHKGILSGRVEGVWNGFHRYCTCRVGGWRERGLGYIKFEFPQTRLGQVRFGQFRLGQICLGQVRLGQLRLGQICLGQVRLGQVRLGEVSVFVCHTKNPRLRQAQQLIYINKSFTLVPTQHRKYIYSSFFTIDQFLK